MRANREKLVGALTTAAKHCGGRWAHGNSVLVKWADNRLEVTGSDGSVGVAVEIPCGDGEGEAVVGRDALAVVGKMQDDEVSVKATDKSLIVTGETTSAEFVCVGGDYPRLEMGGDGTTIDGKWLRESVERVAFAAGNHPDKPWMAGVCIYMDSGQPKGLVATNSFRLASVGDLSSDDRLVVYANHLSDAVKTLGDEVVMGRSESAVWLRSNGYTWRLPVVDSGYPDVSKLLPKGGELATVELSSAEIKRCMRTATIMGNDTRVEVFLAGDLTVTSSGDTGEYQEVFEGVCTGEVMKLHWNAKYFTDAWLPGEVKIVVSSPSLPAFVRDEDWLYMWTAYRS